jgi:hypothetical protein
MGMLTKKGTSIFSGPGGKNVQDGYQSGGTSSFPVTGFPASAYTGNNRRMVGGGKTSQPTSIAGLTNVPTYDPKHLLLTVAVLVVVGYTLWHLDNK